jgi:hypothetical protein
MRDEMLKRKNKSRKAKYLEVKGKFYQILEHEEKSGVVEDEGENIKSV